MIFNVANDSPTLTGAEVTFTIDLEFPHNQKLLPNGDVVWAEDGVFNGEELSRCDADTHSVLLIVSSLTAGTRFRELEPVYPTLDADWEAVFPDGTPIKKDKKPEYVFVWKAWGEWGSSLKVKEFLPG